MEAVQENAALFSFLCCYFLLCCCLLLLDEDERLADELDVDLSGFYHHGE